MHKRARRSSERPSCSIPEPELGPPVGPPVTLLRLALSHSHLCRCRATLRSNGYRVIVPYLRSVGGTARPAFPVEVMTIPWWRRFVY